MNNIPPTSRRHSYKVVVHLAVLWCAGAVPASAHAHEWQLVVHTFSHHFHQPSQTTWNGHNWGVGLRRTLGSTTALQAGAYRNSNFETSAYFIGDWLPLQHGPAAAGVFAGLVSGYRYPLAAGLVTRVNLGCRNSAALRYVPKAYDSSSAMVSLELGWRF